MPGPILKPTKFDAANTASKLPEPLRKPAGMALQGLVDIFGGDSTDVSSLAPTPLAGAMKVSNPAVQELLKLLRGTPGPVDPEKILANSKVTSFWIPEPSQLNLPKGFNLAPGTSEFMKRPKDLVERHATQRVYKAANRLTDEQPNVPAPKPSPFRDVKSTYRGTKEVNKDVRLKKDTPSVRSLDELKWR